MAYTDSTQPYQRMLANYTRTGIEERIPGTKQEGIQRYRTMIYNVVNDSLITAYPLTKGLLTEEEWNDSVQHFFSSHACQSPFLWRMPFEFLEFVKMNELTLQNKYPFLNDLLLYEWVEIEVFMMEDIDVTYTSKGKIENGLLMLNPACVVQYFQYPVYDKQIQGISKKDKGHYFLLTHRNPLTGRVSFLEIAPMFARMFEFLSDEAYTIDQLIDQFLNETSITIDLNKKIEIMDFFKACIDKQIILGYKITN